MVKWACIDTKLTPILLFLLRYGSVYVEYEIVGAVIDARFESGVATVISKMFKGDIKLTISNHGPINVLRVSLKDDNGTEKACEYELGCKKSY